MDLQDKVIVVTGGGQGLGRAIALDLAAKGAKLALVDLNQERLDETVQLCRAAGGDGRGYIANVAVEDDVVSVFDQAAADFGALHGRVIETDGGIRL